MYLEKQTKWSIFANKFTFEISKINFDHWYMIKVNGPDVLKFHIKFLFDTFNFTLKLGRDHLRIRPSVDRPSLRRVYGTHSFPSNVSFFYFLIKIQIFWLIWRCSFNIIIISFSFLFPFITSFIKNFPFSLIPPFSFSSFFDLLPLLCVGNLLVHFLSFLVFWMSKLCFTFSSTFFLWIFYMLFFIILLFS